MAVNPDIALCRKVLTPDGLSHRLLDRTATPALTLTPDTSTRVLSAFQREARRNGTVVSTPVPALRTSSLRLRHPRLLHLDRGRVDPHVWSQQLLEFDAELSSIEEHRKLIKLIANNTPAQARILIVNLGGKTVDYSGESDHTLIDLIKKYHFGNGDLSRGQIIRDLLGFEPHDQRVVDWNVALDPDRQIDFSEIDFAWLTGGPAMPSEVGTDSENAAWLAKAMTALYAIKEFAIPGIGICLGHQLWYHAFGAKVGRFRPYREFGTRNLIATSELTSNLSLLRGTWNHGGGAISISTTHVESALSNPDYPGMLPLFANDYSPYQGGAFPLVDGMTVQEADAEMKLFLTCQSHFELMALYQHLLRRKRWDVMVAESEQHEGAPHPATMLLRNTPNNRQIFFNIHDIVSARASARLGLP